MRGRTKKKKDELFKLQLPKNSTNILSTLPTLHKLTNYAEVKETEKVRHSGHFIDNKLKYNKPSEEPPTLFDSLFPETRNKIEEEYRETITEGIRLGKAPEKLLNAILNILHRKSNTKINEKNIPAEPERFYKGNMPTEAVSYGGKNTRAPMLRITPHELFTEVTGSKDYSGKEIKDYNTALKELGSKQYLITYKRKRRVFNGKKYTVVIDRIEEYMPLIRIVKYYEGLSREEDKRLDEKNSKLSHERGEIILKLNPIFIDQLDTKFILYPTDINKRTEIASGGSLRVTEAITKLRDYLMRAISSKTYTVTIDKKNLPYILGLETYIKQSRKKLISQRIEESFQAVKNLGLALEIKETTGANYQPQYKFILNKDF